jgi:lambda family phage portal protein
MRPVRLLRGQPAAVRQQVRQSLQSGAARAASGHGSGSGSVQAYSGVGADGGGRSPLNARWAVVPRSANADTVPALGRQRAEARELARVNPIASGALDTHLQRIIGTGLVPVATPDAAVLGLSETQRDALIETLDREWSLWADSPESVYGGLHGENFYSYQRQVYAGRWLSGDCATLLPDDEPTATQPYRLRLQLIEADRIGNPGGGMDVYNMIRGVRLGSTGKPEALHVYTRHPGDRLIGPANDYTGEWVSLRAASGRVLALHHLHRLRPDQVRGVPALAVVAQAVKDLGRYSEAEITAAVVAAMYTVFVKRPAAGAGAAHIDLGTDADGAELAPAHDAPPPGPEMALDAGAVIGLADGEEVDIANPGRPNPAYIEFVRQVYAEIGVGLNLPRSLLLKIFDASYTASRAELLAYWQHAKVERYWTVLSLCQPVRDAWLDEAVASGRIQAPGYWDDPLIRWAYRRAEWHGDSQGSVNPKDEVAAYSAAIDARLMTYERAEWELFGSDWNASYPAKRRALQRMHADGIAPTPKAGAAAAVSVPAAGPSNPST